MTVLRELYKCNVCGNVVEVVHEGANALVCCDKPMNKLEAKTQDQGHEKHVPIIKEVEGGVVVEVGGTHHPMEEKHYIKFIEVLTADKVLRAELNPTEPPRAEFKISVDEVLEAREYCNLHGLWGTKK